MVEQRRRLTHSWQRFLGGWLRVRRDPEIPGTTNGEWAFERVSDNDVDALWVVGIACDADVSGAGTCQLLWRELYVAVDFLA